jgi:hypothetical protein
MMTMFKHRLALNDYALFELDAICYRRCWLYIQNRPYTRTHPRPDLCLSEKRARGIYIFSTSTSSKGGHRWSRVEVYEGNSTFASERKERVDRPNSPGRAADIKILRCPQEKRYFPGAENRCLVIRLRAFPLEMYEHCRDTTPKICLREQGLSLSSPFSFRFLARTLALLPQTR